MSSILIDVSHPAHVHLFRNAARDWQAQGHTVLFTALDREMILYLLDLYKLPYRVVHKRRPGKIALLLELLTRWFPIYWLIRQIKADLVVSGGNPVVGFAAWLARKPYLALTDTEPSAMQRALYKPFATLIATPDVFMLDLGRKQVRYPGFHELMYLHPDEFTPDPRELESLGLKPGDPFFVMRFVAWGATHDVGQHGFAAEDKRKLLRELSQHGRIFLTVESGAIDPEFAPLVVTFPPEKVHHLLAFATMYIGEGVTMASEAAVLGTPTLFVNTLRMGYILNERDYGLLFICSDEGQQALDRAIELLATPDLKQVWAERRAKLLADKINPTPWLVDLGNHLLENPHHHPKS